MEQVFVSLGANVGQATLNLQRGLELLKQLPWVELGRLSQIYLTEPQDLRTQPWFHNQVAELWVDPRLSPQALLDQMLAIEAQVGRKRDLGAPRFGPRVLDLDLLLYGTTISTTPTCLLPHPRMQARAFVLWPLYEIAPDLWFNNQPLTAHLERLSYRVEGQKIFQ